MWSLRTEIKVGDDGRLPIGTQRLRIEAQVRPTVVLCQLPSGHYSFLANHPSYKTKPRVLFTNLPKDHSAP